MILGFDTATHAVTCAVHDGRRVLAASTVRENLRHGELLAPGIRDVLTRAGVAPAELRTIVVGVGPGPFTGLRVGVVTALTMAAALGVEAVGVCTLDALAAAVDDERASAGFAVATDARRREVYWATYGPDRRRALGPGVARPAALAERAAGLPVVGRAAALYPDTLGEPAGPLDPDAAVLTAAWVSGALPPLPLEPLYLRRPDTTDPAVAAVAGPATGWRPR